MYGIVLRWLKFIWLCAGCDFRRETRMLTAVASHYDDLCSLHVLLSKEELGWPRELQCTEPTDKGKTGQNGEQHPDHVAQLIDEEFLCVLWPRIYSMQDAYINRTNKSLTGHPTCNWHRTKVNGARNLWQGRTQNNNQQNTEEFGS